MTDPRFALVLEFIQRLRAGEALSVEEFQAEHPEAGPDIAPILREAAGWSQNGDTNTLQIRLEESGFFKGKSSIPTGFDTMIVQDPAPDVSFDKRYRKRRLLGEGGYGKVFLVEDTMHHAELLALKVIRKVHTAGEVDQRFRNEIRVLRALNHASIPMIFNDGTTAEGEIYYTMSYVQGRTLEQIIREEAPLEPERIHRFALQLLEVLVYAHDEGVVHRDLKPSNILVENPGTADEKVQVLDFGIAKVLRHEGLLEQAQTMLTEVPLGTPHYMAPEQVRGQGEDGRTDIYSLGTIIYQMCSGRLPFQGKTSMEILIARLEQTPTDLSSEEAPKWLRETIRRFLRRDRDKRPNAREAQAMIAKARGEETSGAPVAKLVLLAAILLAIPAVLFFAGEGPLDIFNQRTAKNESHAALTAKTEPENTTDAQEPQPPGPQEADRPQEELPVDPPETEGHTATPTQEAETESIEPVTEETPPGTGTEIVDEANSASTLLATEPEPPAETSSSALPPTQAGPAATVAVAHLNAQLELHTRDNEPTIECEVENLNQVGSMLAIRGGAMSAGPDQRVTDGQVRMQLPLGETGAFNVALFDGTTWDSGAETYDAEALSEFSVVIDRDEPQGIILEPGVVLPPAEDGTPRYLIGENTLTVQVQVTDSLPGRVSMPLASLSDTETAVIEPEGFSQSDSAEVITFDIPIRLEADGPQRFESTAFDEAGNSSGQACIFVRDMTSPVIELEPNPAIREEADRSMIVAETATHFLLRGILTDVHPERLLLLQEGVELPLKFSRDGESDDYVFEVDLVDLTIGANPMKLVAFDQYGRSSEKGLVVTRLPLPVERLSLSVESRGGATVFSVNLNTPLESEPNAVELPAQEEDTTRMLLSTARSEVELSADGEIWLAAGEPLAVDLGIGESHLYARIIDGQEIVRRAYGIALEVLPTRMPEGCEPVADVAVRRIGGAFYYERVTNRASSVDMPLVLVPPPAPGHGSAGLGPFYLGEHEVSVEQFAKSLPEMPEDWVTPTDGSLPVTLVLFEEAETYCRSIGADLPSAEQWSWAARGPEGGEYAWGDDWRRDGCNANDRDEFDGLAPSASFPADRSWCGAYDLTGNASEWCRDSENRPKCSGGSYRSGRDVCNFSRPLGTSSKRRENLGFRVVMTVD